MPMDFPSSPTVGQQYNGYVWTGTAWDSTSAQPISLSTTAPGYNYIINGGFDIWQRGTSFSGPSTAYTADRWQAPRLGFATGHTVTRQTAGLTGFQYCARVQRDSGNTSTANIFFGSTFETVTSLPLQGKTVTFSFYARAGANFSGASSQLFADVYTGTGTDQNGVAGGFTGGAATNAVFTLTTSWQRFSFNAVIPTAATQIAPKFSYLPVGTAGANDYFEVTGAQLEEGAAATNFRRNAPSLQAELAACQRYYWRSSGGIYAIHGYGAASSATGINVSIPLPVSMRVIPTSIDYSGLMLYDGVATPGVSSLGLSTSFSKLDSVGVTVGSGGLTSTRTYVLANSNSSAHFIAANAEL